MAHDLLVLYTRVMQSVLLGPALVSCVVYSTSKT